MSILKDLDPQYAKLHNERPTGRVAIGIGAAVFALGGAVWIASQATDRFPRLSQADKIATPISDAANGVSTRSDTPSQTQPSELAAESPPSRAATIRESVQQPTVEREQTAVTSSAASLSPHKQPPAQSDISRSSQTVSATESPSHSDKRLKADGPEPAKRKSDASRIAKKPEKSAPSSAKTSGERDVDIISAIVR